MTYSNVAFWTHEVQTETFAFMQLVDALIQSALHCINGTYFK